MHDTFHCIEQTFIHSPSACAPLKLLSYSLTVYLPSEASLVGTESVLRSSEGARLTEECGPFISGLHGESPTSHVPTHTLKMAAFQKLGLSRWLASQLEAVGFREPTPVQQHCISPILEGKVR